MGLNARKSLDPRWTRHHTQVVVGFMSANITVIRKDPNAARTYNQQTETWNTNGFTTIWAGKARIQPYGIIGDEIVAQDTTGRRLMRVQIEDITSNINLDDVINIDLSPDNPELTSFVMEVRGTIGSSNAWLTDLVCEANLKRNLTVTPPPVGLQPAFPSNITFPSGVTYP